MTEKRYTNLDVWKMGAENTAKLLNELHEENQQIKTLIQEAYRNERTHIGESVLRQLINQIWSE